MLAAQSLLHAFSGLQDPRSPRGVRHPFAGVVTLALLGMLARIRELEVLARWATAHWDKLREALGFDRDQPPCATTISRTLAKCRVAEFQAAFADWLQTFVNDVSTHGVAAVDGKTSKQGIDDNGSPLHMLHVFLHDLQTVVAQWSTGAQTNEPVVLRRHLEELLTSYPMLRLFTGDALFAQRPLLELLCNHGRDYLLQVEANQGNTLDALQHCFAQAGSRAPAAETTNKRGLSKKRAACGSISTTQTTFVNRSICPAVG
jgi:hypothetical protein